MTEEQIKKMKEYADKRELQWTEARIDYNNTWPNKGIWHSDVQKALDEWLSEQQIIQLFEVVRLSETAKGLLFVHAKLNKLISGIIDIYDELPYRPDEGFDIAWRSLEILLTHHKSMAWPADNDKITHLMERTAKELTMPLAESNQQVNDVLEAYLADIPHSVLRYAIMRCYVKHDLAINTQIERVSARAEKILGKALYEDIQKKYKLEEDVKPVPDVLRKSSLLLQKILKGDKIIVNENEYQLNLEKRLIFMLSCVLFTHRCERYHGDYFSPFKSDRASLDTYAFSYYVLSFCYIYFWMMLFKHCEWKQIGEIVSLKNILAAAKAMQDKLRPLIKKEKEK